ncbi:MAG: flagellar hook-basal body complex protein [Planctomycetes bacterium]|nr:flagellar hook-basal body complex protein [Planctomycetota bacterium]
MLNPTRGALSCLLFAACASPPAPPRPTDASLAAVEDRQILQLVIALMTQQSQDLAQDFAVPRASDAAIGELSARIAALTVRLDRLDGSGPATAADAAATHAPSSPATLASIATLRAAIDLLDQQRAVLAENLANVHTTGFKRRQVVTTTLPHEPTGLQLPHLARIEPVLTAGPLCLTERCLDLAIDGDGWFVATADDDSLHFTRAGSLQVDAQGRIVLANGHSLTPAICIPADTLELSIDPEGRVGVRTASQPDQIQLVGRVQLARFRDAGALVAVGGHEFLASPRTGQPMFGDPGATGFGCIKQGFVEGSNVQIVNELVDLQTVARQRAAVVQALGDLGVFVR